MEIKTHYKGRRSRNGGKKTKTEQQPKKRKKQERKIVKMWGLNTHHLKKIQNIVGLFVHLTTAPSKQNCDSLGGVSQQLSTHGMFEKHLRECHNLDRPNMHEQFNMLKKMQRQVW